MMDLDVRSQFGSLNAAAPAASSPAMRGLLMSSLDLMIGVNVDENAAKVRQLGHEVDGGSSARREAILDKVAPKAATAKPTASFNSAM